MIQLSWVGEVLKRFYTIIFFFLFIAAPAAYVYSQARGWIGAAAASLHHSHIRSQLHLWPTPWLMATPSFNPLSKTRDWTCILMDASWILNLVSFSGNSQPSFFLVSFLHFWQEGSPTLNVHWYINLGRSLFRLGEHISFFKNESLTWKWNEN